MGFVEQQVKRHLLRTYQQIKVCNPQGLCKECKKNEALKPQLIEMGICKECKK